MKSSHFLGENFVEDASSVHQDHEVQMAREELYHAAEYALKLHKLLRNVDERQGLEGWVSSKITLANDYLKTVLEYMEYELMTAAAQPEQVDVMAIAENAPMERESDEWLKTATDAQIGQYALEVEGYSTRAGELFKELKQKQQQLLGTNKGHQQVKEMSSGSVATVVNPTPKNKAKTGTLFGGTYKQPKAKK